MQSILCILESLCHNQCVHQLGIAQCTGSRCCTSHHAVRHIIPRCKKNGAMDREPILHVSSSTGFDMQPAFLETRCSQPSVRSTTTREEGASRGNRCRQGGAAAVLATSTKKNMVEASITKESDCLCQICMQFGAGLRVQTDGLLMQKGQARPCMYLLSNDCFQKIVRSCLQMYR